MVRPLRAVRGHTKQQDEEDDHDRSREYLRYVPLYLQGSALLCFEELGSEDRSAYEVVKERLCEYFRMEREDTSCDVPEATTSAK